MLPGLPKMHRTPSARKTVENHTASGNLVHELSPHASVPKSYEVASETSCQIRS